MPLKQEETNCADNYTELFDLLLDKSGEIQEQEEIIQQLDLELALAQETILELQFECDNLKVAVIKFQSSTEKMCHTHSELDILRNESIKKDKSLLEEIENHQRTLLDLKTLYAKEHEEALNKLRAEFTEKWTKINDQLKEERDSKKIIQDQLDTVKKERKKDIERITMEYEAKLTETQRQKIQLMQQQQTAYNQTMIRNKMQHMKESYESQINSLQKLIIELQNRLDILELNQSTVQNKELDSSNQDFQTSQCKVAENRKPLLKNKRKLKKN